MIHWRSGTVREVTRRWTGAAELVVDLEQTHGGDGGETRALAMTDLVGSPEVGDRVLLNVTALLKGLGTGGHAMVVALPDRLPPDPQGPGHIVKARYSPLQTMVLSLEEQESPHHEVMTTHPAVGDGDLQGMPVVVAELHSALPAVLAGVREARPGARVVYVMTDSAALPLAYSRSVAQLVDAGWLTTTITAGQAFGGQHEAITVHSALLAARHVLGCDLAVVAQGPGNAGSATAWGHSGVSSGDVLNAVHVLHGRAVAALRISGADPRPRHRGLSHHAETSIGRVALGEVDVVVPELTDGLEGLGADVMEQAEALVAVAPDRLRLVREPVDGLLDALAAAPVRLSTMGRGLEEDPGAFLAGAAAGRYAGGLLSRP